MEKFKRIFVVVLDSLGVGAMLDAVQFGDAGANTLGHIADYRYRKGQPLRIPILEKMGIGNILPLNGVDSTPSPLAYYSAMREAGSGKDTMTGHWEMMGLRTTKPFQTFTEHGFPEELIRELEKRTGRKIIGNKSASGTEILEELGEEEVNEGHLIVYTSADSVLQICGNEETMGLENLYHYCEIARELTMREEWMVGRVIARPYVGRKKGEFKRTANRHDYAVKPFQKTVLDALKEASCDVISIGKIKDIFDGEGITRAYKSKSSLHGMEQTIEAAGKEFHGLCFVNLVDFDALWGHRRNPEGYGRELERFDEKLGCLLPLLRQDDLLILTADHGNADEMLAEDGGPKTSHTTNPVPLWVTVPGLELRSGGRLADLAPTVLELMGLSQPAEMTGESLIRSEIR